LSQDTFLFPFLKWGKGSQRRVRGIARYHEVDDGWSVNTINGNDAAKLKKIGMALGKGVTG